MQIEGHGVHEASELFPLLEEGELEKLAEDIRGNGLRHPVVLRDGKILDGRNRFLACLRVGVPVRFEEAPPGDPVAYVLSTNLHRRHLTPSQASMVAATAVPLLAVEARRRQQSARSAAAHGTNAKLGRRHDPERIRAGLPGRVSADGTRARDQAAALAGVSPRLVGNALKVRRKGAPEVVSAVERGEVSVSEASAVVDQAPDEQRACLSTTKTQATNAGTRPAARPPTREPKDGVGRAMTRLRLTWREITPKRRRDLIQVLEVFLQMHKGHEDVECV